MDCFPFHPQWQFQTGSHDRRKFQTIREVDSDSMLIRRLFVSIKICNEASLRVESITKECFFVSNSATRPLSLPAWLSWFSHASRIKYWCNIELPQANSSFRLLQHSTQAYRPPLVHSIIMFIWISIIKFIYWFSLNDCSQICSYWRAPSWGSFTASGSLLWLYGDKVSLYFATTSVLPSTIRKYPMRGDRRKKAVQGYVVCTEYSRARSFMF